MPTAWTCLRSGLTNQLTIMVDSAVEDTEPLNSPFPRMSILGDHVTIVKNMMVVSSADDYHRLWNLLTVRMRAWYGLNKFHLKRWPGSLNSLNLCIAGLPLNDMPCRSSARGDFFGLCRDLHTTMHILHDRSFKMESRDKDCPFHISSTKIPAILTALA